MAAPSGSTQQEIGDDNRVMEFDRDPVQPRLPLANGGMAELRDGSTPPTGPSR